MNKQEVRQNIRKLPLFNTLTNFWGNGKKHQYCKHLNVEQNMAEHRVEEQTGLVVYLDGRRRAMFKENFGDFCLL